VKQEIIQPVSPKSYVSDLGEIPSEELDEKLELHPYSNALFVINENPLIKISGIL